MKNKLLSILLFAGISLSLFVVAGWSYFIGDVIKAVLFTVLYFIAVAITVYIAFDILKSASKRKKAS